MDYFDTFENHAFRVESLQRYDIDDERVEFNNFLNNGSLDSKTNNDWHGIIKKAKDRGAVIKRVHIVKLPLTDYLRFEIELYKVNEKFGEQVFVIIDDSGEKPIKDFWLFDDKIALEMRYSADGKFLGWEERKDNINDFIKLKNDLLSRAIPLKNFKDALG